MICYVLLLVLVWWMTHEHIFMNAHLLLWSAGYPLPSWKCWGFHRVSGSLGLRWWRHQHRYVGLGTLVPTAVQRQWEVLCELSALRLWARCRRWLRKLRCRFFFFAIMPSFTASNYLARIAHIHRLSRIWTLEEPYTPGLHPESRYVSISHGFHSESHSEQSDADWGPCTASARTTRNCLLTKHGQICQSNAWNTCLTLFNSCAILINAWLCMSALRTRVWSCLRVYRQRAVLSAQHVFIYGLYGFGNFPFKTGLVISARFYCCLGITVPSPSLDSASATNRALNSAPEQVPINSTECNRCSTVFLTSSC